MNRLYWEITDGGRAALAIIKDAMRLPRGGKPKDTVITPAGQAYLDQHRDEPISPHLRTIIANPARRPE